MNKEKWVKDGQREVRGGAPAADGYECGRIRKHPRERRSESEGESEGERERLMHLHLSFGFICCSFHPFCSRFLTPLPFPPPSPPFFPSLLGSPPFFPSMYCTSSGHGSLSQLQRGCVGTGYLSYYPAPTTPLKHKYSQTHAWLRPHSHTQTLQSLSLSLFISQRFRPVGQPLSVEW